MDHRLALFFGIALVLFLTQSIGGMFQIRNYQDSVRRMHQYGNVGIGQRKGGLFNGYLVLIACDSRGLITRVEAMEGSSFLAKFRPKTSFAGVNLIDADLDGLMNLFRSFDKKQYRKWKGYIQAVDALCKRLYPDRYTEEEMHTITVQPLLK